MVRMAVSRMRLNMFDVRRERPRVAATIRSVKRGGASALLFALLAAIAGTLLVRMTGPTPLPESAPSTSFSAARALQFERDFLGGDVPHPVGTPAHDRIRDPLAPQFLALGYDGMIHHTFPC